MGADIEVCHATMRFVVSLPCNARARHWPGRNSTVYTWTTQEGDQITLLGFSGASTAQVRPNHQTRQNRNSSCGISAVFFRPGPAQLGSASTGAAGRKQHRKSRPASRLHVLTEPPGDGDIRASRPVPPPDLGNRAGAAGTTATGPGGPDRNGTGRDGTAVMDPGYMSRKIRKCRVDKFDT